MMYRLNISGWVPIENHLPIPGESVSIMWKQYHDSDIGRFPLSNDWIFGNFGPNEMLGFQPVELANDYNKNALYLYQDKIAAWIYSDRKKYSEDIFIDCYPYYPE